jgi:hypothetical protein
MTFWISVLTTSPQATVESYLYNTARIAVILPSVESPALTGRNRFVLKVETEERWSAQYQADRLSSGLMGARVHDSLEEAVDHLEEFAS